MTTVTTTTALTTRTLEVPGAVLTYDVRPSEGSTHRPLVIIGSPMGASGFATLAGYFEDRTIVTYDPRGVERSRHTDDTIETDPIERSEDVHRVIEAVGGGPVDLFGSSGGAVDGLALVARHPEDVRVLVAHEPPAASILPDREAALAANRDIHETYMAKGFGAGMAKFIAIVGYKGEIPADWVDRPAPDPAMFHLPTEDDGSRDDILMRQSMIGTTHYEPDFEALKTAPTRIVIGVGATSDGEMAHRGGEAVAARLGLPPVVFPGGHGGFQLSQWDPSADPEAFATKLREVLDS